MIRRRAVALAIAIAALVGSAAPALAAAPGLYAAAEKCTCKPSPKLFIVIQRQDDPDFAGAPGGAFDPAP